MTVEVGILGATGYTGGELMRLLSRHPEVQVTRVSSERYDGRPLREAFPFLGPVGNITCQAINPEEVGKSCDLVFCALPHVASMQAVPTLLQGGCRVVDLSADFRLRNPEVYATWYGHNHQAPELLEEAVFGLPELHRREIVGSRLVANPGCYPTSVILALTPVLNHGGIDPHAIVLDCKSGTSGAGRGASQDTLFCEVSEGFRAYKVTGHRHTPEIEQELSRLAGIPLTVRFTPHLLPQTRGILSTCYVRPLVTRSESAWRAVFQETYAKEPFVRVLPPGQIADTHLVRGSNFCDISVSLDSRTGWLVILSAIDNLVKGAAGQAVQNMNLLLGLPEGAGLEQLPLFP